MERTIRLMINGQISECKALVTDWIDNNGKQLSTAEIDGQLYEVIDRDSYGAVYGLRGKHA